MVLYNNLEIPFGWLALFFFFFFLNFFSIWQPISFRDRKIAAQLLLFVLFLPCFHFLLTLREIGKIQKIGKEKEKFRKKKIKGN
jgi:hypothetical protein